MDIKQSQVAITYVASRDRYADRRWLNPPDVARELAAYVEREGRLPEEWLEVIREEQRNDH